MTSTAAEKESHGHPWRPAEKPAESIPAPTTTLSEVQPAPLQYQAESEGHPMPWRPAEKPDVVPAEGPAEPSPAPAPTLPNELSVPWSYYGHPWDYKEEPDVEGGAS